MNIVHGTTHGLADVAAFIDRLNALGKVSACDGPKVFEAEREIIVTRAPGRLDVMGGIADYSGSLVLQLPIAEATLVALQKDKDPKIRIVSLPFQSRTESVFEMALTDFQNANRVIDYDAARSYFQRDQSQQWAAYVAGVFLVLMRERRIEFREGARVLISSNVPEGKGVSSSAAIEVAVMQAVATAFSIELNPDEMAHLCQMVENMVVGAPCGIMDQMTASCGQTNRLLTLLCQPAKLRESVAIPDEIALLGIDSGVRHSVSSTDYESVRVGAFIGYRIIAEIAGLKVSRSAERLVHIEDHRWGGYLANISPEEFENLFAAALPESLLGADFLNQYHGTTDTVTQIDAARSYRVRVPTSHPVYENYRTGIFSKLISCAIDDHRLELLGNLMYESHAGYSACGLGSVGTDLLVQLVREAGPAQGLFGARITGGGSGGTVAVLSRRDAGEAMALIAAEYERRTGYKPHIFAGSSPGSGSFGHLRLRSET